MELRVLLAVDGSSLSDAAADSVIARVRPEAVVVHILHVVHLQELLSIAHDFARGSGYGSDVMMHVQASRDAADNLVRETARRFTSAGFSTLTAVRDGEPRHAILDYAAEHECDWIVLGSHGRRGLARFLMGSVSEAVARHATCSVLIVRAGRP